MKAKTKALHPAEQYARDVIAGKIIASRWVRLACERHFRDLAEGAKRGLRFDSAAAVDAIRFFSLCRHSKGEFAGQIFKPEPWQQFIVWSIFGWKRADGTRRFRTAHIEVAKKNGKSTFAAALAVFMAFFDGEPGAEVYCVATKKDQAKLVFDEASRMRDASPALKGSIQKFKNNLSVPAIASKCEPLGAEEDTLDGPNIHGLIFDELHAWKKRDLLDVLHHGQGARRQPLQIEITTAGFNRLSVCWDQREFGCKVLESLLDNNEASDAFFVYIACLDDGDDWENEANWIKPNPCLGVSLKIDNLREEAQKAKADPASLNSFLRLRLNKWTQQDVRWMPMNVWNKCAGFELSDRNSQDAKALRDEMRERLAGRTCYSGLDLASNVDLAAHVVIFPPDDDSERYVVLADFWIPGDNLEKRVKRDRVPYDVWLRDGFIQATDGNVIDYAFIKHRIEEFAEQYDLRECAFDPWNGEQFASQMDCTTMVKFPQTIAHFAGPTTRLMTLALGQKLAHLGNPVLRWMADNLVVKQDPSGNLRPNKEKSIEKIDGIVALIMALSCMPLYDDGGSASSELRFV